MGTYVDLHSKMYALWFPFDDPDPVADALMHSLPFVMFRSPSGSYVDILNVQAIRRWTLKRTDQWPCSEFPDEILCVELVQDVNGDVQIGLVAEPDRVRDEYIQ